MASDTSRDAKGADIPILTDVVQDTERSQFPTHVDTLVAELQTAIASSTFALAEQLLHNALAEMEATVFEQVTARLRQELPELIDNVLRRHLGADEGE